MNSFLLMQSEANSASLQDRSWPEHNGREGLTAFHGCQDVGAPFRFTRALYETERGQEGRGKEIRIKMSWTVAASRGETLPASRFGLQGAGEIPGRNRKRPRGPATEDLAPSRKYGKLVWSGFASHSAESRAMQTERIITFTAMGIAGLICLLFLLDLVAGIFGRNTPMDILFIIGGAFLLWQGVETILELR